MGGIKKISIDSGHLYHIWFELTPSFPIPSLSVCFGIWSLILILLVSCRSPVTSNQYKANKHPRSGQKIAIFFWLCA